MNKWKNSLKKADISTAFITIVSVFMITIVFFQNIMLTLETEKYNIMNQYARDALLICETQPTIKMKDLVAIKETLEDKFIPDVNDRNEDHCVKMYIKFGNALGNGKEILSGDNTVSSATYGEQITIRLEYTYKPFRFGTGNGLLVKRKDVAETGTQTMIVTLSTTSKARRSGS